jgi:hypothetical protein
VFTSNYSPHAPVRYRGRKVATMNKITKSRRQELSEKFTKEWQQCRDWLLPFMKNNQPKFRTKDELRRAAMSELKVSNNAFDFGWMAAIEDSGRQGW